MTNIPRQYGVGMEGFDPELARRMKVSIGGEPVERVTSYDIDAGEVVRLKTDHQGNIMLNEARDEVQRETLKGIVTVTLTE